MNARSSLAERFVAGLRTLGLDHDDRRVGQALDYLELLARWNRAYNLSGIDDILEMVPRHLLDSLSIVPYVRGPRVLDIGTGAGLPGIPLAIWLPDIGFHLLDANGKKMRFLFEVKRVLGLPNLSLEQGRAENCRPATPFDCIVSRAVAELSELVRLGAPLLAPGGCLLAMKASVDDAERNALPPAYNASAIELAVPGIPGRRQLFTITRKA